MDGGRVWPTREKVNMSNRHLGPFKSLKEIQYGGQTPKFSTKLTIMFSIVTISSWKRRKKKNVVSTKRSCGCSWWTEQLNLFKSIGVQWSFVKRLKREGKDENPRNKLTFSKFLYFYTKLTRKLIKIEQWIHSKSWVFVQSLYTSDIR